MDEQKVIAEAQQAVDAIEARLDLIPEAVVQPVVRKVNIMKNNKVILAGTAIVALGAGAYLGWSLAKKRLKAHYESVAEEEIREAREHYSKVGVVAKKAEYPTVADAAADLIPPTHAEAAAALKVYQGQGKVMGRTVEISDDGKAVHVRTEEHIEEPEIKQRNIFLDGEPLNEDEWDYDYELGQRTEDKPYIIHEDEFNENEPDFDDMALTYWSGDDVLSDDKDEVVDDVEGLVGERNLHKFGHGSSDPNIVHVRNHLRGLNIEISRRQAKYGTEVLHYDAEDDKPARRRSRDSGD